MIRVVVMLAGLLAAEILFSENLVAADADCSMCHDAPPVTETHPPVSGVSADECFSCHAPLADDAMFQSLHETHSNLGMSCDSCHDSDGVEALQSRLKQLIGD